jgi:hypothetical protein
MSGAVADRDERLTVPARIGVAKTTQPAARPAASQPTPAMARLATASGRTREPADGRRRWFDMLRIVADDRPNPNHPLGVMRRAYWALRSVTNREIAALG